MKIGISWRRGIPRSGEDVGVTLLYNKSAIGVKKRPRYKKRIERVSISKSLFMFFLVKTHNRDYLQPLLCLASFFNLVHLILFTTAPMNTMIHRMYRNISIYGFSTKYIGMLVRHIKAMKIQVCF